MTNKIDENELREFMTRMSPETRIYFGCDSSRFRVKGQWFAEYAVVVVIHINGNNGGKIFAETSVERDYDNIFSKPFTRMLKEAEKVSELHNRLKDIFTDFEVSIHLDISTKKTCGSNVALEAAVGYVKAMTNVTPLTKPNAWSASYAADRAPEILSQRRAVGQN